MKLTKLLNGKKGVSGIITVVILIVLVLAAAAIVWTIVQNLVEGRLDEASSCFEIFEKISLNREYTCYNESSDEMLFSIMMSDAEISQIVVLISGEGVSETIEVPANNNYTKPYKGNYSQSINLPGKNSGKTYVVDLGELGFSEKPMSVLVYSVVKGNRCQASDTIYQIDECSKLGLD